MSTEDAVAHRIKTTAGVVASAALVMVVVFSISGSLSNWWLPRRLEWLPRLTLEHPPIEPTLA
jgi:hypothetical protein